MRKQVRQQLIRRLDAALRSAFPQFVRCSKDQGAGTDPMWVWNRPSNVSAFILPTPMQNTDAFAIEIAWSDDGKFPWRDFVGVLPDRLPRRSRMRLSRLWDRSKQEYLWSTSPSDNQADFWARLNAREPGTSALDFLTSPQPPVDEAISKLDPLVQDVINKLAQYALPLFDRVEAEAT